MELKENREITLTEKMLLRKVSVKDFGAVGDGVHDDTVAVQNALDSLKDSGGTILFPKGTYAVSSCVIFYSEQLLDFEDGAALKRMKLQRETEPQELRYLMASYTSPDPSFGKYNGVHDAVIRGAVFDGNKDITENSKITVFNVCHTKNIILTDCTFIHGSYWHYIEVNSSEKVKICNCIFDASSYTVLRGGRNEIIQIDSAKEALYGPVLFQNGEEMEFCQDEIPCRNIEICYNTFIANGFHAIGSHTNYAHTDIKIHHNIFKGDFGKCSILRFVPLVTNVRYFDNIRE